MGGIDGELLDIRIAIEGCTHKLVVNLHRNVGTRDLSLLHLGVDEAACIGMLDGYGEHQRTAAAVLRHLAGRVGIPLHKRHHAGGCQGAVQNGCAGGTQVRQVVTHSAATLHQLYLFLVDHQDSAIRVGGIVVTDHEAVRQRNHLVVVADAAHRTSLRNDILEVLEQFEDFLLAQWVGIFVLYAGELPRDALVHHIGVQFIDVSVRILEGIFADPYRSGQFVALEIFLRRSERLVETVSFHSVVRYQSLGIASYSRERK